MFFFWGHLSWFWIFLILHSIWVNPVDEALGMISAWSGLLCFLVQYGWNSSEACTGEGLLCTQSFHDDSECIWTSVKKRKSPTLSHPFSRRIWILRWNSRSKTPRFLFLGKPGAHGMFGELCQQQQASEGQPGVLCVFGSFLSITSGC